MTNNGGLQCNYGIPSTNGGLHFGRNFEMLRAGERMEMATRMESDLSQHRGSGGQKKLVAFMRILSTMLLTASLSVPFDFDPLAISVCIAQCGPRTKCS